MILMLRVGRTHILLGQPVHQPLSGFGLRDSRLQVVEFRYPMGLGLGIRV